MRLRNSTVITGLLVVGGLLGSMVLQVNAETQPPIKTGTSVEISNEVLMKAVALNDAIKEETAKFKEQRRSEQENFDNFVASALKHRFINYDMRTKSGLKGYQLEAILKGTNLAGLGNAYAKAEDAYGVSSLVLMGISAHESSWGTSPLSKSRNNLFGFQAYDSDVNAAKYFTTKEDCILEVAKHISEQYLSKDGAYFKGYTLADVNKRYASDKAWNQNITDTLNSFVQKLK